MPAALIAALAKDAWVGAGQLCCLISAMDEVISQLTRAPRAGPSPTSARQLSHLRLGDAA